VFFFFFLAKIERFFEQAKENEAKKRTLL